MRSEHCGAGAIERARDRRHHRIGELHEGRARMHQCEGVIDETQAELERLGEQRQARHHRCRRLPQQIAEQPLDGIGIALHHRGFGIAHPQQPAEGRIELDQHQAGGVDALLDQRRRHRAGSGPEFDDVAVQAGIHEFRHGAGERLARRHHGAGGQRLLHPGAEKVHLVVETQALFGNTQRGLKRHVWIQDRRHSLVTYWSRL